MTADTAKPAPSELAYVPFVSVENMMRLVHHVGIETFLEELASHIEADFKRWPEFDKSPRVASHVPGGVIELMPTADNALYGFKYVNGHPKNTRTGHQTVTAFGVLSEVATGYPVLLTEMTVLTALRTAATSALVARHLAPKDASVMAMIGCGAQCEFQAMAFRALCGINRLRLYDLDPKAVEKASRNLTAQGFEVTRCGSGQEAVEGAQVITTCTADKQYATILTDNMVGAGQLARIIHLTSDYGVQLGRRHAGALQHPGATDIIRRMHDDDRINMLVPAGLEQERHVEHHNVMTGLGL